MRQRYLYLFMILLVNALSFLFHINPICAEDDGAVYRMRFLPRGIAQSYFPTGEEYIIPVDGKTESLIERARSYESAGNNRQALRYYAAAQRRATPPAAPYIAFKLCTLQEQSGEAILCLKELIDRTPGFPLIDAVRFELAFRLFLQGKPQESLNYLSSIEQNENGSAPIFTPSALYFSGIIASEDGEPAVALAFFEQAIESMNATGGEDYRDIYPGLYLEMAKVLLALGSYEQSEKLLTRLYGTAPLPIEQSEALWYLGQVYAAQTQWNMANAAYAALVAQYGETPFALQAQKKLVSMDDDSYAALAVEPVYDETILTGSYGSVEETVDEAADEEAESPGAYALQVGSFSREENALGYVEQLQSLDYPAFLVQAQVENGYYYRVRVGFYETREEARTVLQDLQDRGFSGFILEDK